MFVIFIPFSGIEMTFYVLTHQRIHSACTSCQTLAFVCSSDVCLQFVNLCVFLSRFLQSDDYRWVIK